MPIVNRMQCDTCGKISKTENHYKESWIKLEGDVSIGLGKYDEEGRQWASQWINAKRVDHYFCSWKCFKEHDDNGPKEVELVVQKQDDTDNGSGESGKGPYTASSGDGTQDDPST